MDDPRGTAVVGVMDALCGGQGDICRLQNVLLYKKSCLSL